MSLSFTKYYFDAFNKHVEEYGTKTAVFIQCGSFFEVYGMKDEYRNVYGSNISEVAKICDLNIVNISASVLLISHILQSSTTPLKE